MLKSPDHLYKYRCVTERSLKMLKEGKYFFASAHSFNDPLDCSVEPIYELPHIDKIIENQVKVLQDNDGIDFKEALQKSQIIRSLPTAKLEELLQRIKLSIQQILKDEYGILSLSAKNDDILMWSHYADYHKGFCIQFNRSSGNPLRVTQPVEYVKEYPYFNYFDDLPGNIAKKIILTKFWDWHYEEEWRGIQRANTEVQYTDDMISGIIFGLWMHDKHKSEIYRIFKNRKYMTFYQAQLIPRKFKLETIPLSKRQVAHFNYA
ncbi:DUF2971 domain-containing protein [bacterium]|nr:DUF2971 domain-containing protein [bacterium]